MNILGCVISLVATAFVDKTDKAGLPHTIHCFAIMDGVRRMGVDDQVVLAAAFAYELKEHSPDAFYALEKLASIYGCERLIHLVDGMTRQSGIDFKTYIKNVAASGDADLIRLNMSVLKHTIHSAGLNRVVDKGRINMKKYTNSYYLLDAELKKLENTTHNRNT